MSLTENQKHLIRAICQNDINRAKQYVAVCLSEDNTKKNEVFCRNMREILQRKTLPDLKGLICVEDVSDFQEKRYFASIREQKILNKIKRMKMVSEKLLELGIKYVNATLLYGDSGVGKTEFGRYIAYKLGLPFCYLNFSQAIDSYMGETSKNISKSFSYAVSNPCVFMLDEIDCISIRRQGSRENGPSEEMSRVTISIMQEIDKLPNDVILIAATNRYDRLDEAILRRFTLHHEVKALQRNEKKALIDMFCKDVGIEIAEEEKIRILRERQDDNQSFLINELVSSIALRLELMLCPEL